LRAPRPAPPAGGIVDAAVQVSVRSAGEAQCRIEVQPMRRHSHVRHHCKPPPATDRRGAACPPSRPSSSRPPQTAIARPAHSPARPEIDNVLHRTRFSTGHEDVWNTNSVCADRWRNARRDRRRDRQHAAVPMRARHVAQLQRIARPDRRRDPCVPHPERAIDARAGETHRWGCVPISTWRPAPVEPGWNLMSCAAAVSPGATVLVHPPSGEPR